MESYPPVRLPIVPFQPMWTFLQWFGLLATVALLAGLVVMPDEALRILWFGIIPILPATFLISPEIWRGTCPLATLNMMLNGLVSRRFLRARYIPQVGAAGIALLVLMVPARRFLFNENGLVLVITVVAVAVAALVLGAFFDYKAGFCNAFCPVLPVERLYGQGPLASIGNPRCTACTLCTDKGCYDLAPARSLLIAMGAKRRSSKWLLTPYGMFAASFPGFVYGYFMTVDGPLSSAGIVYLTVGAWMLASWLATSAVVLVTKWTAKQISPALGALAVMLYYWFSGPAIAAEFGLATWVGHLIQLLALILVVIWLWKKYSDTGTLRRTA